MRWFNRPAPKDEVPVAEVRGPVKLWVVVLRSGVSSTIYGVHGTFTTLETAKAWAEDEAHRRGIDYVCEPVRPPTVHS